MLSKFISFTYLLWKTLSTQIEISHALMDCKQRTFYLVITVSNILSDIIGSFRLVNLISNCHPKSIPVDQSIFKWTTSTTIVKCNIATARATISYSYDATFDRMTSENDKYFRSQGLI